MKKLVSTIMDGISNTIQLDQDIQDLKKRLAFLGYVYDENNDGPILKWIEDQKVASSSETTKSLLSILAVSVLQVILRTKGE